MLFKILPSFPSLTWISAINVFNYKAKQTYWNSDSFKMILNVSRHFKDTNKDNTFNTYLTNNFMYLVKLFVFMF